MPDEITIQSIKISATADTAAATEALNKLAESLQKVKAVAGMEKTAGTVEELARAIKSLGSADVDAFAKSMDKLAGAFERISKVNFDVGKVGLALKALKAQTRDAEVAARQAKIAADAKIKSDRIEASKARLPILQQNAATAAMKEARLGGKVSGPKEPKPEKKSVENLKDFNKEYDEWVKRADNWEYAEKFGQALSKHVAVGAKQAAVALGSMLRNMAIAPFKRLINSVKDITSRLHGFFAALKRIAVYRAIRAALKEITQAFREGIENLYQFSKEMNGTFAQSMDTLATAALYAKNSLAAMAAPIINVLAPAIDYAVDRFVEFLNVVNELIASLTGAETWTRALKYPKEYAEALDDANGSAKKLRATLLGFDEINRLDDNSRGRRGSAGDELDYSKMFTTETVSTSTNGVIKAIKDAFDEGNFSDIGKTIGEKLKKGLDKIPWSSIKDRVTKNAASVATLINGFIDVPGLGESLGKTIAEVFNVAVDKVSTFYDTVEWRDVGAFLGDGLNSLTTNFNFSELARTLAKVINGGVNLISGFIDTVNWNEFATFLADGINGFFDELETKKLGETISKAIVKALNAVATFFKKTDFEEIGEKIGEFLKGIDWQGVFSGLSQLFFNALSAAFDGLVGLIKESPVFGSLAAIAIASKVASMFGAPKVTSLLTTGLMKLLTGGAEGAAASATAEAATTAVASKATGGIIEQFGLGSSVSALPVSVVALSSVAAAAFGFGVGAFLNEIPAVADFADSIVEFFAGGIDTYERMYDGFVIDSPYKPTLDAIAKNTGEIKDNTAKNAQRVVEKFTNVYGTTMSLSVATQGSTSIRANLVKGYAGGGMPETGSVFLAGERGVELISSSGSGTQVANRDQISASVANGMIYANEEQNALLREQNALLREIASKDFTPVTQITTGQIASALNRANIREGSTLVAVN